MMIPGVESTLRPLILALALAVPCSVPAADPGLPPAGDADLPPPPSMDVPAEAPAPVPASPTAPAPASPSAAPKGDLPLAYKGVSVGMSLAGLKAFVSGQPRMMADQTEALNGVVKVTLYEDMDPGRKASKKKAKPNPDSFFTIGCDAQGCYPFQSATVVFLDGKAVSFSLRSQWTLQEALAEPGLKGWMGFVGAAFNKKYGPPALVSVAPGQDDLTDIKNLGNAAPFVQWNSGPCKVLVELSRSGDRCKAAIEVQDNAGAAQLLSRGMAGK